MKQLTAIKKCNATEIDMMLNKAAAAYANARITADKPYNAPEFRHVSQTEIGAAFFAEYEATVRCIAMFVKENIYEIQSIVGKMTAEIIAEYND